MTVVNLFCSSHGPFIVYNINYTKQYKLFLPQNTVLANACKSSDLTSPPLEHTQWKQDLLSL